MFVDQNTNELKANVWESKKVENVTSSYDNSITQNKDALTSQEESATETISLFKTCQNDIADQHSFKQELPTSMNCAMQNKCCNTMHDIDFKIISNLKSLTDHSSQITEMIKQKVCQVNKCPNCYTKIDCKSLFTDITAAKTQESLHNTFNDKEKDIKLACDMNIMYTVRNDGSKCVYVLNHIDEHAMTVHAEKRMQRLDKSDDKCTVSSTFTEDQIVELPSYNQHVNNVRINDNTAKYSEAMIKEQQKRSDCDSSVLNDRLHSLEFSIFDINSFDIGSNAEVDCNLKSFPKEADEITNNYIDDSEPNFLNNIQSETLLDDFFWQSSEQPDINCDNLTGVPLTYTDYDLAIIEAKNTSHNLFGNDENDTKIFYDKNVYMCTSDRDKCIYVKNHTDEHIVSTSAEKGMQYLNNSKDTCTVSTTSTEDQFVESSLDSQRVNSDNKRKCDYEDTPKYFEDTMNGQQGRNNCDTSMSNEQLHSSELYTLDFLEIDSKEASEIMRTDCINDFENISCLHNIQTETLDDILLNDTTNFLPLKQSLFELDTVYTDTSLNKKNVLCNNQNNAIDSSIDLVASHLNADNTFLRLPAKSDKSVNKS